MTTFHRFIIVAAAITASSLLTPTAEARRFDVERRISEAETRRDYRAIAEYFEQQARHAKARAARHERMAERFRSGSGRGLPGKRLAERCHGIAKRARKDAKALEGLANAYREARDERRR